MSTQLNLLPTKPSLQYYTLLFHLICKINSLPQTIKNHAEYRVTVNYKYNKVNNKKAQVPT